MRQPTYWDRCEAGRIAAVPRTRQGSLCAADSALKPERPVACVMRPAFVGAAREGDVWGDVHGQLSFDATTAPSMWLQGSGHERGRNGISVERNVGSRQDGRQHISRHQRGLCRGCQGSREGAAPRCGIDQMRAGGGSGIRTHGPLAGSTVFKTVAFNHSAIPPGIVSQALTDPAIWTDPPVVSTA